eukprot:scaffold96538_cov63-Phaeocystis_antarctica.AAC.3
MVSRAIVSRARAAAAAGPAIGFADAWRLRWGLSQTSGAVAAAGPAQRVVGQGGKRARSVAPTARRPTLTQTSGARLEAHDTHGQQR